jgi:hypothetical protein
MPQSFSHSLWLLQWQEPVSVLDPRGFDSSNRKDITPIEGKVMTDITIAAPRTRSTSDERQGDLGLPDRPR